MLRRSFILANAPELIGKPFKGKHTPDGLWLNTNNTDQISDLGPGDFKVGIFDPFWQTPFIAVYDRMSLYFKRAAIKLVYFTRTLISNYPLEQLYRLRRIVQFGDLRPQVRDNAFIAPSAVVIGNVVVGRKATVGYNCIIHGDTGPVRIGESACINDKAILRGPCKIGKWTTIDPNTVIDQADVASCSMVGAKSVVGPGCKIESGSMLCAASVLKPGTLIPSGEIWSGNPAMKLGTLTDTEKGYIVKAAKHMVLLNLEHTATWEVTYEDQENIRLGRETWAQWAAGMIEVRVRPYYSRAGPKDTGRFNKSPLEALQGRIDGGMFESQHIEGGNKGNMW
jgi:carbonic anhydrase/acetyltransferase-like protein (isoleucine patch superfamily)